MVLSYVIVLVGLYVPMPPEEYSFYDAGEFRLGDRELDVTHPSDYRRFDRTNIFERWQFSEKHFEWIRNSEWLFHDKGYWRAWMKEAERRAWVYYLLNQIQVELNCKQINWRVIHINLAHMYRRMGPEEYSIGVLPLPVPVEYFAQY